MKTIFKPGDVVTTTRNVHLMKIETIEGDMAVCIYHFMGDSFRVSYPLDTLTFVRH